MFIFRFAAADEEDDEQFFTDPIAHRLQQDVVSNAAFLGRARLKVESGWGWDVLHDNDDDTYMTPTLDPPHPDMT